MTHKEAVKKALEELGGRAQLKQIYPRVIPFVKYNPGSDIKATLRLQLQTTPELFRRTQGRTGWYELVSYQEELAERDRKIVELSESCLTKEIIIKAFDDCDNLAERMNAKYVMTVLFGKFPVWRMAAKGVKAPAGTIANTFRHNPYMRDHVDKWSVLGARQDVLKLRTEFENAIEAIIQTTKET